MQVLGTRAGLGVLLSPLGTNLPPMAFQGELAQKLKPLREKEQDKILDLKKKVCEKRGLEFNSWINA